jgi:cold shock protein
MLNGLTRPKGTDLQPDDGSKDLFVHISAVERAGLSTLNKGAIVS